MSTYNSNDSILSVTSKTIFAAINAKFMSNISHNISSYAITTNPIFSINPNPFLPVISHRTDTITIICDDRVELIMNLEDFDKTLK